MKSFARLVALPAGRWPWPACPFLPLGGRAGSRRHPLAQPPVARHRHRRRLGRLLSGSPSPSSRASPRSGALANSRALVIIGGLLAVAVPIAWILINASRLRPAACRCPQIRSGPTARPSAASSCSSSRPSPSTPGSRPSAEQAHDGVLSPAPAARHRAPTAGAVRVPHGPPHDHPAAGRPGEDRRHRRRRGDARLVPRVRLLRHLLARPPGRPRRPQAGAAPDPVRDVRDGPAPRPRAREELARRRRRHGQVPPARRRRDLRRAGAHGAAVLAAPARSSTATATSARSTTAPPPCATPSAASRRARC